MERRRAWRHKFIQSHNPNSNTYFFDLAYRSDINQLNKHLSSLGFGGKACIDCFEEDKVFVPEPSWKMNKHNFGWFKGDTVNMGVGKVI